jgi:uncharacterized protein YndB with AHSA1/START domain
MKTILGRLEFALEREIAIRAPRALVFRYFTDPERWARWWGKGSTIDGRAGGALEIVYPGGTRARGEVLEIRPPERIVFSFGYEGAGKPIAPGGSRVTIQLAEDPQGTRFALRHELSDAATRDAHVQGWRYHLAVFANVVTSEAHAGTAKLADAWFALWNEPDASKRRAVLAELLAEDAVFQDAHGCTRGLDDLDAHVTAARVHMPGIHLVRSGEPRHCQGTVLVAWVARKADGQPLAEGTTVLELTSDGRIARVVGFWG